MRLLYTQKLALESFEGASVPPYAVLSHTWGQDEVTYQDMIALIQDQSKHSTCRLKKGFSKIKSACKEAYRVGLEWVWIDTCCIDKSSSSELSEAINSMFQWYQDAAICYVYLEDINYNELALLGVRKKSDILRSARWFSRGWTLQELIAPNKIEFFCSVPETKEWRFIGSKQSELEYLADITGIDRAVLEVPGLLSTVSVARRMSWAASRQTTRLEDIAYCLLGVFQVNMPLLYGEGAKAFIRLQEEILKSYEDESLFAWTDPVTLTNDEQNDGILATHPRAFGKSSEIVPYVSKLEPYVMTNRGLRIESRLFPYMEYVGSNQDSKSCILHCRYESTFESSVSIAVEWDVSTGRYRRSEDKSLRKITSEMIRSAPVKTIYIHKCGPLRSPEISHCYLRYYPESKGFNFEAAMATSAEPDPRSRDLDTSVTKVPSRVQFSWNMRQRALIAPNNDRGYFGALLFSQKSTGGRIHNNAGFLLLLSLPSRIRDTGKDPISGVYLIPTMRTPNQADLHQLLEAGFRQIKHRESTLDTGNGLLTASLVKEHRLGDDIFALDIVHKPSTNQNASAPPDIKIFDPQDNEVAQISGHEALNPALSSST